MITTSWQGIRSIHLRINEQDNIAHLVVKLTSVAKHVEHVLGDPLSTSVVIMISLHAFMVFKCIVTTSQFHCACLLSNDIFNLKIAFTMP